MILMSSKSNRIMAYRIILASIFLVFMVLSGPFGCSAQRVSVIIYHEIVDSPQEKPLGKAFITRVQFEEQMRYLYEQGFTTLSMQELVEFMQCRRNVPKKSVVINFDDGWSSQRKAFPILNQYNFKASFWIITGDGYGDVYFRPEEIKAIDAHPNWEVGSHTVTHPWNSGSNLMTWLNCYPAGRSREDVRRELADSKARLEQLLNHRVTMLAWPCGWYNRPLIQMAQENGYEILLTTIGKANVKGGNVLEIRRFFVDGCSSIDDFKSIVEYIRYPSHHDQ